MKTAKILALVLVICLAFNFTACDIFNTDTPPSDTGNPPSDTGNSPSDTGNPPSTDGGDENGASTVNVIMVNDNHGILNEQDGGIDKIASGISYYASLGEIVKIANGDMFQGTYVSSTLRGLPMLDVLNALDFDAFVLGNHEFDWGLDEIKKYKDGDLSNGEAEFPFLGANIYDRNTGKMVDWLEPYAIVELGEIKIGIIGIIGDVETSILSAHVEDYEFVYAANIVKDLTVELRTEEECDVVLVASHGDDYSLNYTLAEYDGDARIDGIFTGHTHRSTDDEIEREDGSHVCVLQNGGYGDSFATLTLEFDENGRLKDTDGRLNYTNRYSPDASLGEVFAKYAEYMAIGETVLFTSDEEVSRYDVGLNIVYSMYARYQTDFAVINTGGVRAPIPEGEVTYADVFQILPFENEVYIVALSGELLKEYLNSGNSIYYWGINISTIEDGLEYEMAIVDFVYLGYTFDNYRNDSCVDTNELIRDVFIEFLKESVE